MPGQQNGIIVHHRGTRRTLPGAPNSVAAKRVKACRQPGLAGRVTREHWLSLGLGGPVATEPQVRFKLKALLTARD